MTIKELTLTSLVAALAVMTGCPTDDTTEADTEDGSTSMDTSDPTTDPDTTATTGPTTGPTTTDPDTTATETDGDTEGDTDTDTEGDTDNVDPNAFDFREDDPSAYTRVDRKGFPALNTALIASENKDAYNDADPTDDVAGTFAGDAVGTLQFLHGSFDPGSTGLNDDLVLANMLLGTNLTPCGATRLNNSCLQQAVPLAFPDVLLVNTTGPTGFPNGRTLDVPVIDVILAAVLIEAESIADLLVFTDLDPTSDDVHGLSQSPNDVEFAAGFPYLGAAHE